MKLEFGGPGEIIFGSGSIRRAGELARRFGARAAIVTGGASLRASGALERVEADLRGHGVESLALGAAGEPTVAMIDELVARAREFAPDCVLAIGGGGAMDAGKAVAALLSNAAAGDSSHGSPLESCREFLEGVGSGRAISRPSTPVIAAPTTAGTGSEATKNSVIRSDDWTFKKSMRSPFMRPAISLVDPELTMGAPAAVTAASGADALTQLVEAFVTARRNTFTDGLAREGLRLAAWALERVHVQPDDLEAREAMAMASLIGGVALDNAGLGAVHGLASPIGAFHDIPHGVICANLLAPITAANIRAAREREDDDPAALDVLKRYGDLAQLFNGDFACEPEPLAGFLEFRVQQLGIPTLGACGMTAGDIPRVIANCRAGSMRGNPFELDDATMAAAIERALGGRA